MESKTNHESQPSSLTSPLTLMISPQTVTILASLLFAVLCIVVFAQLKKRRSGSWGNVVLLVGAPDAGKTAILSTLLYKQTLPTLASLQINSSVIALTPASKMRVVDVPGHPRMRDQFRDYVSEAKAVVFVVDASTISRTGPAVAEYLHIVLHSLTSLPPSQRLPALLILAHKADLLKSTSTASDVLAANRVKSILERELEKRRVSQSGGVTIEGLGAEGERSDLGGLDCSGPEFRFAEWEGGEVTFMGSSVRAGNGADVQSEKHVDGLSTLREWLLEML